MATILDDLRWKKFSVLDQGYVSLVDVMGSDDSIVQAARVSYGEGTKQVSDDRNLIRYLMRHRHTSPLEMCELKFLIHTPMDCWRQWIRHRTACLSGATKVHLRDPHGRPWDLSVQSIYRIFQKKTGDNSARHDVFRPITNAMINAFDNSAVESLNELLDVPQMNKIVDIWEKPWNKADLSSYYQQWQQIRSIRRSPNLHQKRMDATQGHSTRQKHRVGNDHSPQAR